LQKWAPQTFDFRQKLCYTLFYPMKMKNAATDALPGSGALFFAAYPKGFVRGRAIHA
jgi:hypothetical protein